MKFVQKIKVRLIMGIVYIIIGAALTILNIFTQLKNDVLSMFGAIMLAIGVVYTIRNIRLMANDEAMKNRKIYENDERNVMLYKNARSIAFYLYIIAAGIAVMALYLCNLPYEAQIVAYSVCALCVIYWITYFILRRKY